MSTSIFLFTKRHWSLFAVLAFWAALLLINLGNLVPSVQFRGVRFSGGDFGQYYMGGVVAHIGIWEDLYPFDLDTAPSPDKSTISTRLSSELAQRGANTSWKYIYPPPLAPFLAPLDWVPYRTAQKAFTLFLFGAVVWLLVLLRRECDDWNLPDVLTHLLILSIGTGLPVCESIMMANATPLVALGSLLALRSLRKNHVPGAVFAFALAGLLKGFSLVWTPALFVWKHWRILFGGLVAGLLVCVVPHFLGAPADLWDTFFHEVVPGSRRLYEIGDDNLGLPSFIAWILHDNGIPGWINSLLTSFHVALLGFAYYFASRWKDDTRRAEGLVLFLSTIAFQLFSPICWPHYACNIVGFMPVGLSLAGVENDFKIRGKQWLSPCALVSGFLLVWYPIGNAAKHLLGVPLFGFCRTLGYVLLLGWCLSTLFRHQTTKDSPSAE